MESSKKFFSLGYVVEDKAEDSFEILVYPIEAIPTADGQLSFDKNDSLLIKDRDGNNIATKYEESSNIKCYWYPNGEQNRVTAPDVCKGDIVEIYTYGEQDKYFWSVYAHNRGLRKREKVLFFFSNKEGIGGDSSNAYFYLFDTRNKKVHFHTANNDGEACGYDMLWNTASGIMTISDTLNNSIELKSTEGKLTINTNEKIILNTKEATVNCEKSTINASNSCDINTSKMTIKSDMCYIN